jgi:predicted Zn-dependent protease
MPGPVARDSAILATVRFVGRVFACALALVLLPIAGASIAGRGGAIAGIALSLLALFCLWLWLPRSAHRAFEAGKYTAADRRYRILGLLAPSTARERAAALSRAGCLVAASRLDAAERILAAVDSAKLAAAERAVWLNNRACADLAAGRDPTAALALVDEASAIRPDVPALQHTRGMALLAVGRIDDAIAVLDGMRSAGELPPRLEAERCRDLAKAWSAKGETAYAEDYRLRAEALAR